MLIIDLLLLIIFFTLVIYKTYKILNERRKGKLGSETSLRYILFFSTTTLLPSILIVYSVIGIFGVYRMNVRKVAENPDSTITPLPATITPAGLELDPDTPETLDNDQTEQPKT